MRLGIGASAVPVYTRADPVPGGRALGEVRVVQPALMAHASAAGGRLRFVATVDLEGATMGGGELTPGAWGEGFVDRRHPHTYFHELILSANDVLGRHDGRAAVSLSVGKGFAPFGTDDPMSRPVLRYPVNHHLAQILERAVLIGAIRYGPVTGEVGLFNGDEPERPSQWPRVGGRLGDSWSGRLLVAAGPGTEVQASRAHVHSPEHRPGAGPDQEMWSVSARWQGRLGRGQGYGLVEWARSTEADGFFVFNTALAEGAWTARHHRLYYRFERTERPEEERTLDPFRTKRPHVENSTLGTTRWTIHTVGYGHAWVAGAAQLRAEPFVELSYGTVAEVGGGLFDPRVVYGGDSFWTVSLGARLSLGEPMHRMGRYGLTAEGSAGGGHHHE